MVGVARARAPRGVARPEISPRPVLDASPGDRASGARAAPVPLPPPAPSGRAARICARARVRARGVFSHLTFSRATRPRTRAGEAEGAQIKGDGPTNQHHRKCRSININQSLHHSIQARIACPVRPAVGPPGRQASAGRSEGRGRRAQWSANQTNRAIDRSMATDESIDSSSSASSVVVGREAVLPVCDPVLAVPTCSCSSEAGGRLIYWPGSPP